MKIISNPADKPWSLQTMCSGCRCVLEIEASDMRRVSDTRDGDYGEFKCPQCGRMDSIAITLIPLEYRGRLRLAMSEDPEYEELKALARMLPEPTPLERAWTRLSWAYGNLACTTNHKPVRAAFRDLALEQGISEVDFDVWADKQKWRKT